MPADCSLHPVLTACRPLGTVGWHGSPLTGVDSRLLAGHLLTSLFMLDSTIQVVAMDRENVFLGSSQCACSAQGMWLGA